MYAIIGGAIGGALLCCSIAGAVVFVLRKRKSASNNAVNLVPIENWGPADQKYAHDSPYGRIGAGALTESVQPAGLINGPEFASCRDEGVNYTKVPDLGAPSVQYGQFGNSINYNVTGLRSSQVDGYQGAEFVSCRADGEA